MFIRHFDVTANHNTSFEYDRELETITVTVDGQTEVIDLSGFPLHAKFEGIETELAMNVLHDVQRTEAGLFVTLLKAVPKAPAYYDTDWKEVTEDGELRVIGDNGTGDNGGTDTTEVDNTEVEDEGGTGTGEGTEGERETS